jgi:potassium/hydrogen antiporter
MHLSEPQATALFLTVTGTLLGVGVVSGRVAQRVGIPVVLVFMLVGLAAGSEGLGGIAFENYPFALRLGTIALVLILFDGGLNTPVGLLRQHLRPAATLATVGVLGTAALVALAARGFGFSWAEAALIGAIVSSTDAAAVFSVLRGGGVPLERRVATTIEVESGLNDPMAFFLTTLLTGNLLEPGSLTAGDVALRAVLQVAVGGSVGALVGVGGRYLLIRVRLSGGGVYPVLTVALAFLAYGVTTLLEGSGFLAVYVAAVLIGNARLPFHAGLRRVHDALAWLSQATMFLMLGLLAYPSRLMHVAWQGLGLALLLAFVARPVAVALCLLPFRYRRREALYIGWVGLRGAVPIVLAMLPVIAGAPGAGRIFDVAFCIVVASALFPGGTVAWVTRRLRLGGDAPPAAQAVLEIASTRPLQGELLTFCVEPALAVAHATVAALPFPEGAAILLVVRGEQLIPVKGDTVLMPGDYVHVFAAPEDVGLVLLLFGRPVGG